MIDKSVEMLKKLVAIDTRYEKDTLEAVNFIKEYLEGYGAKVELDYNENKTRAALLATIGDENKPGIVLSGHLDTVSFVTEEWDTDPLELTEKDGKLYGRGTADMKSSIAVVLANIEALQASGKTFHLILTHDEEGGFKSITKLHKNGFNGFFKKKPVGCIVMEPTAMKPIGAHKGARFATVDIIGKESHSGYPALGVNAIDYMFKVYEFIQERFNACKETLAADGDYDPDMTTLSVCVAKGGDAINKIPGKAELSYNIRCLPQDDMDAFTEDVRQFCQKLGQEMKKLNPHCDVVFTETLNVKGFMTDFDSQFVKRFGTPEKVSYGTEAGFFSSCGIDTVVFGPGDIAQAHTCNEFIEKCQVERFDRFITEDLCSEPN